LAAAGMAAIAGVLSVAGAGAGEVRTLSLYHVHTKETLTVTYKVDGRYVPAAMNQLNYILRDWRRNAVTRIDPETIDLMWELHEDLGSTKPIHIISGYRSAETNALLRRIGRNVARHSQHIQGRAIDLFFPDVPTERIRNSALVRQVGGVGFYPSSGAKGFVHIDSGNVRHWPRVSEQRMAQIFRDYRSTVGARLSRASNTMVAAKNPVVEPSPKPVSKPQKPMETLVAEVPKPRARPMEILVMAAQRLQIEPAAWPVQRKSFAEKPMLTGRAVGQLARSDLDDASQRSNISAKGSFAFAQREGTVESAPLPEPIEATASPSEISSIIAWTTSLFLTTEEPASEDGRSQPLVLDGPVRIVGVGLGVEEGEALHHIVAPNEAVEGLTVASNVAAKADMLVVNRAGKSDFGLASMMRTSALEAAAREEAKVAQSEDAVLRGGERPLGFQ
jgi:uncharacterized protein YcbK (DUF882 family)